MIKKTLLLELGTEELPPKTLLKLAITFADGLRAGLHDAKLSFANITHYSTPRRLGVMATELDTVQPSKEILKKGPSVIAAYNNDGEPTAAALGFARSCGVEVSALTTVGTDKDSWLAYRKQVKGQRTVDLIPQIFTSVVNKLPSNQKMRWGSNDFEFVRPVRWVVAMLGRERIECSIFGIPADCKTYGHPFHHPQAIILQSADDYPQQLQHTGKVIADFNQRKASIQEAVHRVAAEVNGQSIIDKNLLNEVTALVEWPVAVLGAFDKKYLALPEEVMIATMQRHQRYFLLRDSDRNLIPYFISIANIDSSAPELIRHGNERVIVPRLSDAEFFWQRDIKIPLVDLTAQLTHVVFQEKLGSLHDKSQRIGSLATAMADVLHIDRALVERSAILSKCDLLTDMVGEFPDLQGIIGRYYATHNDEHPQVALALEDQYKPRFSGDDIPQSKVGQLISIADKLDTLVGIFAIGKVPKGDKDPFALRRAALGVLRTLIEGKLELDLQFSLEKAAQNYSNDLIANQQIQTELIAKIFDFMMERLRYYYIDRGISVDNIIAVLARRPTKPYDFDRRLNAVIEFRKLPQSEALIATNKRISNILRKSGEQLDKLLNNQLLQEDAELKLAESLAVIKEKSIPLLHDNEYSQVLKHLAGLQDDVDHFFDNIMVVCEDLSLKNNRLALLNELHHLFLQIADISQLQCPN